MNNTCESLIFHLDIFRRIMYPYELHTSTHREKVQTGAHDRIGGNL